MSRTKSKPATSAIAEFPEVPARQLRDDPHTPEVLHGVHELSLSVEQSLSSLVRPNGPPVGLQLGGLSVSVNSDGDATLETKGAVHPDDLASMAGLLLGVARFFNVGGGRGK